MSFVYFIEYEGNLPLDSNCIQIKGVIPLHEKLPSALKCKVRHSVRSTHFSFKHSHKQNVEYFLRKIIPGTIFLALKYSF